jgi:hypothetical protein
MVAERFSLEDLNLELNQTPDSKRTIGAVIGDIHVFCVALEESELSDETRKLIESRPGPTIECSRAEPTHSGQPPPIAEIWRVVETLQARNEEMQKIIDDQRKELTSLKREHFELSQKVSKCDKFKYVNFSCDDILINDTNHSLNNEGSQLGFLEASRQKRKFNSCEESKAATQVGAAGSGRVSEVSKKACYSDVARDGGASRMGSGTTSVQNRKSIPSSSGSGFTPTTGREAARSKVSTIPNSSLPLKKERINNHRGTVVGSGSSVMLKSAPRLRMFYAGFWEKDTTCDGVLTHLRSLGVEVNVCEQLKTRHPSYCSFKFECDLKFKDTVMNPNNWPVGILVKRFYESRPRVSEPQAGNMNRNSVKVSEVSAESKSVSSSNEELMIL